MKQVRTHLFLVGDDLIPNITPALDPAVRPTEVCLLGATSAVDSSVRLEKILKQAGISVSRWEVADPWDIEQVRTRVKKWIASQAGGDIALNVTGGTRPMGLGAYEVFVSENRPVYFVNPINDSVDWLLPHGQVSMPLADRIKFPAFFSARDMRLVECKKDGIPSNLRSLTDTLIRGLHRFERPLSILNALASHSEGSLVSPPLEDWQRRDAVLLELIGLFASEGLLTLVKGAHLRFPDEDSRFFVNGGWLEQYVFDVLVRMRGKGALIQDLARSLSVEWDVDGSPVKNEIDVAFIADNRPYLIECKTRKFDSDEGEDSLASEAIYKLDTLRCAICGVGGRAMLVSYRGIKKAAKQRADELRILVCDGNGINGLESRLTNWTRQHD